ncbi:hypothetical protein BASA81_009075 [Batrachochytrium salamandrivorans]|nr:hypothetical protein BASA81_009075 [Batrachochytrium salamandrivorans]
MKLRGKTWRAKDLVIMGLVACLVLNLLALNSVRVERDDLQTRLSTSLRSTTDNANTAQAHPAMELPEEEVGEEDYTTVVLFCYNRADYLDRTLRSLASRLGGRSPTAFPNLKVIISQDGKDAGVERVIERYLAQHGESWTHIQHERELQPENSYFALAQHYKRGLDYAFNQKSSRVIVLEDDLELAVDFFEYFAAFATLLDRDRTLLCVSAWNDHGQAKLVSQDKDYSTVYRTDFFPGLGWMLTRELWQQELAKKWPRAYWDDWLREPEQRRNRQCIRPAISRTTTFGQSGSSQGQFYREYLAPMVLNNRIGDFHPDQLEPKAFDQRFMQQVADAVEINSVSQVGTGPTSAYKLLYSSLHEYQTIVAPMVGMIPDVKAGVPRQAYRGIVPVRVHGHRLFLVPQTV